MNGTYDSAAATVTSVGRYCFRADFAETGNAGIPSSSDHSVTECFTVTPKTPHITTQAGTSPVDFGNAVTDTGTLSRTANEPGSPVVNPTTDTRWPSVSGQTAVSSDEAVITNPGPCSSSTPRSA